MKNNLLIILLALGLLIPAKQTVAQLLPKHSTMKEQQKPTFRNGKTKVVKLKKERTFATTAAKTHKVNNLTYDPIASLPYTNSSSLDENSYLLGQPYPCYAEGYALTLNKDEIVQIFHQSDDFDCILSVLDSSYNLLFICDDYYDSDNDDYTSNSQIVFSAFYTGTYYIVATGYDEEEIGDYTISVDFYSSPLSSQAYYVDALYGDDANSGLSSTDAMQTIQAVLETTNNGTIYIMSDILLDTTIVIKDGSTVCLAAYNNGTYTVKRTNNCALSPMIYVLKSILYLGNETIPGGLVFDGGYNETDASPIMAKEPILMTDVESMVFIYPANTFQHNHSGNDYVPVIDNSETMYMYGGSISNNVGVAIYNSANFILFDGSITDNEIESYSGVYTEGTFVMYGGNISNNIATDQKCGVFNMWFFYMYGGNISENEAEIFSGIYNVDYSYFVMKGGSVRDNQADMGSGIINIGTATISGGSITGNVATTANSGILNVEVGVLILSGGNISGNISMDIPNHGITHFGESCVLSDSVTVGGNDQICLLEGSTITVNGTLTNRTVGTIMPFKEDYNGLVGVHRVGLQILSGSQNEILADYTKFKIANDENNRQWYLTSLGKLASDDVSIADYTNESSLNVYPNPATDMLEININNMELGKMYLQISDISGKLISKTDILEPQTKISVKELANGVYILQLFDNTQMIETKKLIKQ